MLVATVEEAVEEAATAVVAVAEALILELGLAAPPAVATSFFVVVVAVFVVAISTAAARVLRTAAAMASVKVALAAALASALVAALVAATVVAARMVAARMMGVATRRRSWCWDVRRYTASRRERSGCGRHRSRARSLTPDDVCMSSTRETSCKTPLCRAWPPRFPSHSYHLTPLPIRATVL
eukprot:3774277-Pleurochrysis_carterae.AAC.1